MMPGLGGAWRGELAKKRPTNTREVRGAFTWQNTKQQADQWILAADINTLVGKDSQSALIYISGANDSLLGPHCAEAWMWYLEAKSESCSETIRKVQIITGLRHTEAERIGAYGLICSSEGIELGSVVYRHKGKLI